MTRELVLNVTSSDISIALLEDKQLVELNKEKNNLRFSVGDIYLGRVKRIMIGLNAVFVDVGYQKDAFLHYLDLGPQVISLQKYVNQAISSKEPHISLYTYKLSDDINKNGKISNILKTGQTILVQVAKEPISTKGPRLTSEISIAGRNLVLMPLSNKVSVSQKIDSIEERNRLKRLIQSIKPNNYGVIIRTIAQGKKVSELDSELKELISKWENAFKNIYETKPPKLIIGEIDRTSAILRDMLNPSFSDIYINDETLFSQIKDYIKSIEPEKEKIVKLFSGTKPIFEHFGIEKQIKSLFGKTVSIKSGAYLIIERTEALHVIDVNSGNRSVNEKDQERNALEVNMLSAEEIARQLRLRDLGGIIVVDFIDMHESENRQKLYEHIKTLMENDHAKHHILPLSKFGLLQITRQRVRPETNIVTIEVCPICKGSGEVAPSIIFVDQLESNIEYLLTKITNKVIKVKVHPYIYAFIKSGFISIRFKWIIKYKRLIKVAPDNSYTLFEYHFFESGGEEIEL
ncbi:MAG: ribonuclease G [Bacteroidetes bacterium GWA2_32_17]|nr:MAG: ribonuclease G [Bacteroidetes bacterium GWA2_32_17]